MKNDVDRLISFNSDIAGLEPKYQYFISEMLMIRLSSLFEQYVSEIAYKLAAGAHYTNGSVPILHVRAPSMQASRGLFLSHGRARPVQQLRWTKPRYIRDSIQYVIPSTESFVIKFQNYGNSMSEMQAVRNYLAHRSKTSKEKYKELIRNLYGANVTVPPGAFLVSKRFVVPKFKEYSKNVKIILEEVARGV